MEIKKLFRSAGIAIIATLLLGLTSQTQAEEREVTWIGSHWSEDPSSDVDKDLSYPPITAYIESSVLYICNDKPAGALDIAIVSGKSGRVVWEQIVPEAATSLVTIPLDALPAGEYTLQLANEWGGYLCGSFRK